jgi:hypothetical protein
LRLWRRRRFCSRGPIGTEARRSTTSRKGKSTPTDPKASTVPWWRVLRFNCSRRKRSAWD